MSASSEKHRCFWQNNLRKCFRCVGTKIVYMPYTCHALFLRYRSLVAELLIGRVDNICFAITLFCDSKAQWMVNFLISLIKWILIIECHVMWNFARMRWDRRSISLWRWSWSHLWISINVLEVVHNLLFLRNSVQLTVYFNLFFCGILYSWVYSNLFSRERAKLYIIK